MSETQLLESLLQKFLDDRDGLSDQEFTLFLEALRTNSPLAERLKDHLMVEELLAQQYGAERKDFVESFEQRLRMESSPQATSTFGQSSNQPMDTYALRRSEHAESNGPAPRTADNGSRTSRPLPETSKPRPSNVSPPANNPSAESSGHPWLKLFAVLAFLLLLAGGLLRLEYLDAARKIAEIKEVSGMVLIYRDGVGIVAAQGMPILPGDEIRVREDGQLKLAYRDQSQVTLEANSQAEFQPGMAHWPGLLIGQRGKRISVLQGTIQANIARQPPDRPMILETPQLKAKVLGTRLMVAVEKDQSRVDVLDGLIAAQMKQHEEPPVEVSAGYHLIATKDGLQVSPGDWPSNREGLVFLLSPNATVSRTPDLGVRVFAEGPRQAPWVLRPRKDAQLEEGRMVFRGGAFLAEDQTASELLAACLSTNELSIEATFQTSELSQAGLACWISFSSSSDDWNFSLVQEGQKCRLRLLTSVDSLTEQIREIPLFEIPDDQPHHLTVTYSPGLLRCYLDGKALKVSEQIPGTFAGWKSQHLLFGDEWNGNGEWRGTLEGIALFNRALSAEEAARNALHYRLQFPRGSKETEE